MSFRLLPKSLTLNDLEWPLFCIISPNTIAFGAYRVKVVEDTCSGISSADEFLVIHS